MEKQFIYDNKHLIPFVTALFYLELFRKVYYYLKKKKKKKTKKKKTIYHYLIAFSLIAWLLLHFWFIFSFYSLHFFDNGRI